MNLYSDVCHNIDFRLERYMVARADPSKPDKACLQCLPSPNSKPLLRCILPPPLNVLPLKQQFHSVEAPSQLFVSSDRMYG